MEGDIRLRGGTRIVGLLAGLALIPGATAATAAPPRTAPTFFGVGATALNGLDQATYPMVDAMAAARVGSLRVEVAWNAVQPFTSADQRWRNPDAEVRLAVTKGIRPLLLVAYGTNWAMRPGDQLSAALKGVPLDQWKFYRPRPELYAAFARKVVRRYGRGGQFWEDNPDLPYLPPIALEIWNEPNMNWAWRPAPNAEEYGDLYRLAAEQIHQVDPNMVVLVGGLHAARYSTSSYMAMAKFLNAMGDLETVEGIAVHSYAKTFDKLIDNVTDLRAWMDAHELADRPITVTEWGWPSNPPVDYGLSEADLRPALYRRFVRDMSLSDCGVRGVLAFEWLGTISEDHPPGWSSGLSLSTNGGLTPTAAALAIAEVAEQQSGASDTASRATIHHCNRGAPDSDADGIEDQHDFAPLDSAVQASPVASAPASYEPPVAVEPAVAERLGRATTGTWDGSPLPAREVLSWEHCAADGSGCVAFASGPTATPGPELIGRRLRVTARATNDLGSATATGPLSKPVETPPFWLREPQLLGPAAVGELMWLDRGDHVAIPAITSEKMTWESCTVAWTNCRLIKGSTKRTSYQPPLGELGRRIRVRYSIANRWGTLNLTLRSWIVTL